VSTKLRQSPLVKRNPKFIGLSFLHELSVE
jgi:hypothetical protein